MNRLLEMWPDERAVVTLSAVPNAPYSPMSGVMTGTPADIILQFARKYNLTARSLYQLTNESVSGISADGTTRPSQEPHRLPGIFTGEPHRLPGPTTEQGLQDAP
eukprot:2521478-Karenia_brevis.AAC.1